MISLNPLRRLIEIKDIKITQLSLDVFGIPNYFEKGRLPNTANLVRICRYLDCDISDIIEYTEEEVSFDYTVDYMKLKSMTGSIVRLAGMIGMSPNTLSTMKTRNQRMKEPLVDKICAALKCSREDFCEKDN